MSESIRVVSDPAELEALPEGAVIVDGDGLAKQKNRGTWRAWFDRNGATSRQMLDPDTARPPISILWIPEIPA